MLTETINVKGQLKIKKYDENKQLINEYDFKNLVVYTGKKLLASRLFADTRGALAITGASGSGTGVTFTFSAQAIAPYNVGQVIKIVGMSPAEYNGSFRVLSCTTSQVVVDHDEISAATVFGTISSFDNSVISEMAVGEVSTVANISDINLYLESGRVPIFSSQTLFDDDDSSVAYIGLFEAGIATTGNGAVIQEAALLNGEGIMMCRTVFSPVTKTISESLEIFWKITIS